MWSLTEGQHRKIGIEEDPVAIIEKKNNTLIFQALKEKDHYSFNASEKNILSFGSLVVLNKEGQVTLNGGEIKGNLLIDSKKFLSKGTTDVGGKAVLNIQKGKTTTSSILTACRDIRLADYTKFTNNGKIASKRELIYGGDTFCQGPKGMSFAGISIKGNFDTLNAKGKFIAPIVNLFSTKHFILSGVHFHALQLLLTTSGEMAFKETDFKTRDLIGIEAKKSLMGDGTFLVANTNPYEFPFHLFYENASPEGKRSLKFHTQKIEYFKKNPLQRDLLGFHCQSEGAVVLSQQSQFDILIGQTHFKATYADIASHIYTGYYNQHGVSINAKEVDFSGVLESLRSHFNSEKGDLNGNLKVEDLLLTGGLFNLGGDFIGKDLTVIGQDLVIQKEGSAQSLTANLNLKTFTVDGKASFEQAQITSNQGTVSRTGTLTISHLENNCPSWKSSGTTQINSFESQTPNLSLEGSISIDRANIQTNHATLTGVKVDYLTLLSAHLTASHTKGKHWDVSAITTNLENSAINELFLRGDTLKTNNSTGYKWNLGLNSAVNLNGGYISQMSLQTPHFTTSHTQGGDWEVLADYTTLENAAINQLSLRGKTLNAYNSSGGNWYLDLEVAYFAGETDTSLTGRVARFCNSGLIRGSVNLMGDTFLNTGVIQGHTCNLDYKTYPSLGYFNVRDLSLTLNDRPINEDLLTHFERTQSFHTLNVRTDQHLRFTNNFSFGRSLGLSAPRIEFASPLFHHHRFAVGGSLHLDSRHSPLTVKIFDIHAGKNLVFTGAGAQLYKTTFSAGYDVIGDLDGKADITASHFKAGQDTYLNARLGVDTHAIEHIYSKTSSHRTGIFGWGKKTTTHTWTEIEGNSFTGRKIYITSPQGSINLDTTCFGSADTILEAQDPVTNLERIGFDETTTSKSSWFGLSSSQSRQYTDVSSPTVFASTDTITVRSHQDRIHMPSTVFLTPGHLSLWAKKDIYQAPPTLRREFSFESTGLTVDNFFLKPTMPDPLLSSIYNVFQKQGISQISAATQAGTHMINAIMEYKNAESMKNFLKGRAIDAFISLFNVNIGLQHTDMESSETFQGEGGIYVGSADIKSEEGDFICDNGLPIYVQNLLKIDAVSWIRNGFEGKRSFESSQTNMGVTVNPFTGFQGVNMSGSQTSSASNYWIPQITQAGKLITNVRSIQVQEPVSLYSVSSKSSFGFSASPSGAMSGHVNGYGGSYAPSKHGGSVGLIVDGNEFCVPLFPQTKSKTNSSFAPFISPQAKEEATTRASLQAAPKSILFEKTSPKKSTHEKPTVYRPTFKVKPREYSVTQESTPTSPILKSRETVWEEVINRLPKPEAPQKDNTILTRTVKLEKNGLMHTLPPQFRNPQTSEKIERPKKSRKTTLGSFALASIPFGLDSTSTSAWYFGRYSKVLNLHSKEVHSGTYSLGDILQTNNGYYVVEGHGSPNSMELNNEDLKKNFRPSRISNIFPDDVFKLAPLKLAQLMYENGYQGEDVVLTGCNVAAGEGTYPQELADTLDSKVLAFTGTVSSSRENSFHKLYCYQEPEQLEKYGLAPHEGPCQLKTFYPKGYKQSIWTKLTNAGLDVPFLKQYLVEPTVERLNYGKERVFGLGRGLRNIGLQIASTGEFVWDAAILYAGNDWERERLVDPSGLSQAPRLKDTETYRNSSIRMGERIELLKDLAVVTLYAPSRQVDQLYTSGILTGQRPWESQTYKTSRQNIDNKIVAPLNMVYNNYINASDLEKAGKEVEFITTLFGPGVLLRGAQGLGGKGKPTPPPVPQNPHFPVLITEDIYNWLPDPIEKKIRLKKDFLTKGDKLTVLPLALGKDQLGVYIGNVRAKGENSGLLFKTIKNIEEVARHHNKSTLIVEAHITNRKILDLLQKLNNKNIIQFYYNETFYRSVLQKESLLSVLRQKIFSHDAQKELLFKNAHFYPLTPTTDRVRYNVKIIKKVKPLEIDTPPSLSQKSSLRPKNKISQPKNKLIPFAPGLDTRTYFFNAKFSDIKLFSDHIPGASKIAPPKPHMRDIFVDTVSNNRAVPGSGYAIAQLFVEKVKKKIEGTWLERRKEGTWQHHPQAPFFLLLKVKEDKAFVCHHNGKKWKEIEVNHRDVAHFIINNNPTGKEVVIISGPFATEGFSSFVRNLSNSLNRSVYFEPSFELVPYKRPNTISAFTVDEPFTKYTPKSFKDSTIQKTSERRTPTLENRLNLYKTKKSIHKLQKAYKELGRKGFNKALDHSSQESSAAPLILSKKNQDTPNHNLFTDFNKTEWRAVPYSKIILLENKEGKGTRLREWVEKLEKYWPHDPKGTVFIIGHGDFEGVLYGQYLFTPGGFKGLGKSALPIWMDFNLSSRDLARFVEKELKELPFPNRDVVLLTCEGGGIKFAQDFTNKLGGLGKSAVYAPSPLHYVLVHENLFKIVPVHPTIPEMGFIKYTPRKFLANKKLPRI